MKGECVPKWEQAEKEKLDNSHKKLENWKKNLIFNVMQEVEAIPFDKWSWMMNLDSRFKRSFLQDLPLEVQ